jgi:hypothetical protein
MAGDTFAMPGCGRVWRGESREVPCAIARRIMEHQALLRARGREGSAEWHRLQQEELERDHAP